MAGSSVRRESVMDALGWQIDRSEGIVTVSGEGLLDLSFLKRFREAMRAEGTVGFCKLFDVSRAKIQLCGDDPQVATPHPVSTATHGKIAILLGRDPSQILVDTAVLLKNRIGSRRRLRIFTDEGEARRWLLSEALLAAVPAELPRLLPGSSPKRNSGR